MRRIKKNFRVLRQLVYLRLHNIMMYRLSFFGPFLVDGSLFLVQLIVFQAIYSNIDSIGNWEKGEMILYIGTFSMINAINMVIYFFGINGIPSKVRNGEIDLYLTKPISPLFRLTFEQINPSGLPLVIMSLIIIIYGIYQAQITIDFIIVSSYIFWVILMTLLYYDMEVCIRSMSFYFVSTAKFEKFESACLDVCMQLPGIVYYGIYKVIFCFLLPYGIMATIPVQSIVGELTWKIGIYGILIVGMFTLLTGFLWKTGLRHYNSVSS